MPHFIKWDYAKGIAIEYERLGECNQCGECCQARIEYHLFGSKTSGSGAMGLTTNANGIWAEFQDGRIRRFIGPIKVTKRNKSICSAFEEGKCLIHAVKSIKMRGKQAVCAAWPIIPEHVKAFKSCSYSFKKLRSWKF